MGTLLLMVVVMRTRLQMSPRTMSRAVRVSVAGASPRLRTGGEHTYRENIARKGRRSRLRAEASSSSSPQPFPGRRVLGFSLALGLSLPIAYDLVQDLGVDFGDDNKPAPLPALKPGL